MREVGDGVWESGREPENAWTQEDGKRSRLVASSQLIDDDENGNPKSQTPLREHEEAGGTRGAAGTWKCKILR